MKSQVCFLYVIVGLITAFIFFSEVNAEERQSKTTSANAVNKRLSSLDRGHKDHGVRLKRIELKADLNSRRAEEISTLSDRNQQGVAELDKAVNLNTDGLNVYRKSLDQLRQNVDVQEILGVRNEQKIERIQQAAGLNKGHLNRFWMLLAALLVFFMQAGFKVYEVGLVRMKDRNSVGIKNLLDWMVVSLIFYLIGFAFMFGESVSGLIGFSFFAAEGIEESKNELGYEFFLFQIAFAATATTIVSGTLAIRTKLFSYLILALFIGGFVYPLFGHWVWGDHFIPENTPWLASMGFLDFAGGTVVHSVGAWVALVGAFIIRPRLGKFIDRETGRIAIQNPENFRPYDLGYSILGLLILWVGWWGFNGGSTVFVTADETNAFSNTQAPSIILNTSLAGAAAGLVAFLHSYFFQQRKHVYEKLMGGTLGGLVSITACANVVSVGVVVLVVAPVAGIIHNLAYDWLNEKPVFNRIIDDPIGAIAVHGPCGIWGTLCVALGEADKIKVALGPYYHQGWSRLEQFGDQLFGVLVCFFYTVFFASILFKALQSFVGLEVSFQQEAEGDIVGLADEEKSVNPGLTELAPQPPRLLGK